ncbi:hypothetical protein C8R42DRAFT_781333 [Lentinula raphanica]|nr:hypothetical protein C8R42DRAFT_781333 [Lentinula raphanica]
MAMNLDSDGSLSLDLPSSDSDSDGPGPSSSAVDTNLLSDSQTQVRKSTRIAMQPSRPNYRESESPHVTNPDGSPYDPTYIEYIDDDLNDSPARNVLLGQGANQKTKNKVIASAPHRNRCLITHIAGIEVQFCHLLARATNLNFIRYLEWLSGLLPGELNVNSRYNIVCLKAEIHILMDNSGFILLPSKEVLLSLQELCKWNETRPDWEDRRLFKACEEYPELKAASYEYSFLPIHLPANRKFSRIKLVTSSNGELVETSPAQWTDYTSNFQKNPDLQRLKSHAHPFFVCCHAYQQLERLLDDRDVKKVSEWRSVFRDLSQKNHRFSLLMQLTSSWEDFHVPAFFNKGSIPAKLVAAKKKNAVLKGLAFPSSSESPKFPLKGKRKSARSAPAASKEMYTLPALNIEKLECELYASRDSFKWCIDRANETLGAVQPKFQFFPVDRLPRDVPKPAARTALPRYREGSMSPSEAARRKKFKLSEVDTVRDSALSTSSEEEDVIASTSAVPLERLPVAKRGGGGRVSVAGSSRSHISKGKQKVTGSTRAGDSDATASTSAVPLQRLGKRGGRGSTSVAGSSQSQVDKGKKKATG